MNKIDINSLHDKFNSLNKHQKVQTLFLVVVVGILVYGLIAT